MKKLRSSVFAKILSIIVITLFILPFNVDMSFAKKKGTTKIKHTPIKYFVPGYRIKLEAEVKDKKGINLVRCYFKAAGEADYVFITMNFKGIGKYEGILPAPNKNTGAIEYLFLAVNDKNEVVKTQTFVVKKKDKDLAPSWQVVRSEEDIINVSTELARAPEELAGFTDSITMDVVESSLRFGYVAGIYSTSQMAASGGTSGTAASSASSGTATASSAGGVSTWVWVAAGVAAAGGGAAAAGGLGGGGSSGGGGGSGTRGADAQVKIFDNGSVADDKFSLRVDGVYYGETQYGSSNTFGVRNLAIGAHTVKVTYTGCSPCSGPGTLGIELGSNVTFSGGGRTKDVSLNPIGDSVTYTIYVS